MVGTEMQWGAVCDFDFLSVPVIMGRKPAHMQFAHQPLIVSDCCHGHSKNIRCERWKLITKAYATQNKHCLHTNYKCGLHCHQNTHCSLWEEYSWRHNYNIWCCINKISKKAHSSQEWTGNPSSQSIMGAYTEKKAKSPSYRWHIFPPNPMLFSGFQHKWFSGFWRSPLSPFTNWEFIWTSLKK